MPQTTTAINACDAVIRLDNSVGALTDVSGSNNSFELQLQMTVGDFKTFASKWKGRITCGKDATIKIKAIYSMTAAEMKALLTEWYFTADGAPRTFQVDLPDSSTGSDRYTCEVVLENYSIPGPADEAKPIMMEISLLPAGELTYAVI